MMTKIIFLIFISLVPCFALFAQDGVDEDLQELEKYKEQQALNAKLIKEMSSPPSNSSDSASLNLEFNDSENLPPGPHLLNDEAISFLIHKLKNNPFKSIPDEQLKAELLKQIKNKYLQDFVGRRPWMLSLATELLKDEKALLSTLGMFSKKKHFRDYFFIWLCLMIFSWAFKKYFFRKSWSGVSRFSLGVLVSLTVSSLSLFVFYVMFEENLSPAVSIVAKYF